MRKRLIWLWAGLAAGCTGAPEPPAPAEEPPLAAVIAPRPAPPPAPEPRPEPDLCAMLAEAMADERDGFVTLRGAPLAGEVWQASAVLPGTQTCTIEGESWPRARLSCASEAIPPEQRARIDQAFAALAAEVDRCLRRASWFPRTWHKGELFEFAMGERQQTWTDRSTLPPSAVVLKVQQDLASRDYRLQVNLETVRR